MQLHGILFLHENLLCKKEALDTYHAVIGGENVVIRFPRYHDPEDIEHSCGFLNPLLPPLGFEEWKRDNRPIDWGSPRDYPAGDSEVACLGISIECQKETAICSADAVYSSLDKWCEHFLKYCFVCNKQMNLRSWVEQKSFESFTLFSGNVAIPPKDNVIHISVNLANPDSFVSREQVQKACDFASSNHVLLFEYELLLKAYQENGKGNDRYAILDAASSLEHCLVSQIERISNQRDIPSELILSKYRSLGDRVRAIQLLDQSFLIKDIDTTVVKPRNSIMHNGNVEIDSKITFDLLKKVEEVLQYFYNDYYSD